MKRSLVRVARHGDNHVHTFVLNTGAWDAQADYYNQNVDPSHLLLSVKNTYDFSIPCDANCTGGMYIRKLSTTTRSLLGPPSNQRLPDPSEVACDGCAQLWLLGTWNLTPALETLLLTQPSS